MNVFYFSSNLFVSVLATSIVSLLENNQSFDEINIFVGDDGITQENKNKLSQLVFLYKRNIVYIPLPSPSELFDFPFVDRYQIGHSYPRMAVDKLLPEEVDRVLCLDSDTLILNNLSELWNIDLCGNIMAGVADCINLKAYKKQFNLVNQNEFYCNAGVFLIDLKKWRYNHLNDEIKQRIKKNNGNIFFFEQTLMNYVCRGRILKLHPKYNTYTALYAFEYENLLKWRQPTVFYSKKEIEEAKKSSYIIHFTRNFYMLSRPWVQGCDHPMTNVYVNYKKKTPWPSVEEDNRTFKQKIKYALWHILPPTFLCMCANVLYNYVRPKMWWRNE